MPFKQNGIASFLLGCICGYAVANAFAVSMSIASFVTFVIALIMVLVYSFPES